jgi:hypothetical protein
MKTRKICKTCGKNPVRIKGKLKDRSDRYGTECYSCHKKRYGQITGTHRYKNRKYLLYKKDYCELCGFIAIDHCQLDVHHLDGNHNNNEESNLQTVCANCHRLISKKQMIEKMRRSRNGTIQWQSEN